MFNSFLYVQGFVFRKKMPALGTRFSFFVNNVTYVIILYAALAYDVNYNHLDFCLISLVIKLQRFPYSVVCETGM